MNGEVVLRLGILAICCLLLFSLLILGGSGWRGGPDAGGIFSDPTADVEDYSGGTVEVSGVVVETDPVVLEIEGKEGAEYVQVEGIAAAEKGERLSVYGTITEEGVLAVNPERSTVQEPWEYAYMYLISLVGLLFVVVRGVRGWRFDRETLSLSPREEPRYSRQGSDDG